MIRSMAIFARRTIQRMLDHNCALFPQDAVARQIKILNASRDSAISTEWEVAVLFGLSFLGAVRHEPLSDEAARPDVYFENRERGLAYIGDIVTVTDFGIDDANPLRQFEEHLARRARKLNVSLSGIRVDIGTRYEKRGSDRREFLALPPVNQMSETLDSDLDAFLKHVGGHREDPHECAIRGRGIELNLKYAPGQNYFGFSLREYNRAQSLKANPLYYALDRKAKQLKAARAIGTTVIVVCDGAAGVLRDRASRAGRYGVDAIVQRFLAEHTVSAVGILGVRRTRVRRSESDAFETGVAVYTHPSLAADAADVLREHLTLLVSTIPRPESDALNAINYLRSSHRRTGRSFVGGLRVDNTSVKISSRAIQDLLAGRVDQPQFLEYHGITLPGAAGRSFNPFLAALSQGRLIEKVEVEKSADSDDDWLVFHFSERDPAIAPFRLLEHE